LHFFFAGPATAMRTYDKHSWNYYRLARKFEKVEYKYAFHQPYKKFRSFRVKRIRSFHSKKNRQQRLNSSNECNYNHKFSQLMKTITMSSDNFFGDSSENGVIERENNWLRLNLLGEELAHYFAWAIPTEKALHLITSFSPILEIGAGKGYWSYLLRKRGVSIRSFDRQPNSSHSWTLVEKGTPSTIFESPDVGARAYNTLLLCYPDEDSELSVESMDCFEGDYIIHIGELITTGTLARYPQSPFGRTTSSSFQIDLLNHFHCIACLPLPSFPFCYDHITVWKRTEWVLGRGHLIPGSAVNEKANEEEDEEEHDHDEDNEEEDQEENDDDEEVEDGIDRKKDYWANIPMQERIPHEWISPKYQHLIKKDATVTVGSF
jgi:hypothetical protein